MIIPIPIIIPIVSWSCPHKIDCIPCLCYQLILYQCLGWKEDLQETMDLTWINHWISGIQLSTNPKYIILYYIILYCWLYSFKLSPHKGEFIYHSPIGRWLDNCSILSPHYLLSRYVKFISHNPPESHYVKMIDIRDILLYYHYPSIPSGKKAMNNHHV